jgi:hypothetical protein
MGLHELEVVRQFPGPLRSFLMLKYRVIPSIRQQII